MRIDRERLKKLCDQQNISLSELLRRAAVSPTAYYALARKEEILPRSIRAIAASLVCRRKKSSPWVRKRNLVGPTMPRIPILESWRRPWNG